MRRIVACVVVGLALVAGSVAAQSMRRLNYDDIYCSGNVTNESIPYDTYLISGEESSPLTVFSQGNLVFINRGSSGGVNIGDEFLVMRKVQDPARFKWFEAQNRLARAMGAQWADIGRLKVVAVYDNTATARVIHTCDFLQRGDYVRPIAARSTPEPRMEAFDLFPKPTGRPLAMVVNAKNYQRIVGTYDIIYVNLGSGQGVKEGDYFRIFRYQGINHDTVYQLRNRQYMMFGFGSTPVRYSWKDLPREMLGEGIVLRVSENASVVLITRALKEIFMGDYVELKDPAAPRAEAVAPAPAEVPQPVNHAPTLGISADRHSALAGERIRITGRGNDSDGDPLTYSWRASGGQVLGAGPIVQLDTSGLSPGRYTVTGRVEDGRGGAGDASLSFEVSVPPAPQASQANELLYGPSSARLDNVGKRMLDDVALRMRNEPRASVVLIGYADPEEANAGKLAAQRAESAKVYLVSRGITADRVSTRSSAGQAGAGRQNQRVDVIWVPEGANY